MVVKCPVCGANVPETAAVEIPVGDSLVRFCSLRCAESVEAGEAREAPPPAVPEPPRRILVAVDGSGPSLRATQLAASLARATGGSVELIHAIDTTMLRIFPIDSAIEGARRLGIRFEELEPSLREDAEAQLERCRKVCRAAGVKVSSRVEMMPPARAVADASAEFDLVVVGSRGLGALSGAALGSLSHRVIRETQTPVLVVH
jgi:nucleotide-binding universal stress UspA family protein